MGLYPFLMVSGFSERPFFAHYGPFNSSVLNSESAMIAETSIIIANFVITGVPAWSKLTISSIFTWRFV